MSRSSFYLLFSDDVAYVSALAQLGTHRFKSVRAAQHAHRAGVASLDLGARQDRGQPRAACRRCLAVASYSILIAVMLLTARLVARETGATAVGLAAMALVGTTSVMLTPAIWYSAGQPLWAGFGILATLWYAQSYRRSGKRGDARAGRHWLR